VRGDVVDDDRDLPRDLGRDRLGQLADQVAGQLAGEVLCDTGRGDEAQPQRGDLGG
jgi:hypothetical protein